MIVDSCAMNLAMMPVEALSDANSAPEIIKSVEAARIAFHTAPDMTEEIITKLREQISADVEKGLEELDQARADKRIITES
jgi:hypothetical protein